MKAYYERLAQLRSALLAAGEDRWAADLLSAERSAMTSGEALSNTAIVIKQLLTNGIAEALNLQDQVQALWDEGQALWDGQAPTTPAPLPSDGA